MHPHEPGNDIDVAGQKDGLSIVVSMTGSKEDEYILLAQLELHLRNEGKGGSTEMSLLTQKGEIKTCSMIESAEGLVYHQWDRLLPSHREQAYKKLHVPFPLLCWKPCLTTF
jgi:hypothetical protein